MQIKKGGIAESSQNTPDEYRDIYISGTVALQMLNKILHFSVTGVGSDRYIR